MKATFEFDMNDLDDVMAHLRCTKSTDMASALWNILLNSKKGFEFNIDADKYKTQYELLDAIYSMLHQEMEENDINIEKLMR